MKKVAGMLKFDDDKELKSLKKELNKINNLFGNCLSEVVKQIPLFNVNKLSLNIMQGTDETHVIYNGKNIGTIKTQIDYSGDDFANNKISFVTSFTPTLL